MTDIVERLRGLVAVQEAGGAWVVEATAADVDEAAAEIERLRAAQAWQPIETAPRDGSAFMGARKDGVYIARWHFGVQRFVNRDNLSPFGTSIPRLTHWRPLLDAPA